MDRLNVVLSPPSLRDGLGDLAQLLNPRAPPPQTPPPWNAALLGHAQQPNAAERLAHIVRTIEADIIPRLVRAHRGAPAAVQAQAALPDAPFIETASAFAALVLAADDGPWAEALDAHLARGVSIESLYLELLTPTARELGRLWMEDEITFADVTVGVGRLQRILRLLSPDFGPALGTGGDGRRVLLLAPGTTHTFGVTMVAEFFRRAGWDVVGHSDARCADPFALVAEEWFDVVGLSVATDEQLQSCVDMIQGLRRASRNQAVGVLVGGPSFALDPSLAGALGADAVAADAAQAPGLAELLLESRAGRLAEATP
jgi:methanogenic corrinoid protein MtbC1